MDQLHRLSGMLMDTLSGVDVLSYAPHLGNRILGSAHIYIASIQIPEFALSTVALESLVGLFSLLILVIVMAQLMDRAMPTRKNVTPTEVSAPADARVPSQSQNTVGSVARIDSAYPTWFTATLPRKLPTENAQVPLVTHEETDTTADATSLRSAQSRVAFAGDIDESLSPRERARALGLSVIIPVYNERDTIVSIIIRVMEQIEVTEVVVVNDGSTDGTTEVLEHMRWPKPVRLLRHTVNQGKGAAIRTGIAAASQGIIIVQDADLEYDPADYKIVLQPIWDGQADVVYGSRFLTPRPFSFWLDLANRLLTFATNVLYGSRLTDMETCYKAFRSAVLKNVTIVSNRFDFEPEITAKVLRQHLRVVEVPISYERRSYDSGKKIKLSDAFAAVRALIRFRLTTL